jgi:hypothetical protein
MKPWILLLIVSVILAGCVSDVEEPVDNITPADNDTVDGDGTVYDIDSFEECAAAGYPVMESYPRQCRTPDGRTFVSLIDLFDTSKDTSCTADEDCVLVDRELGFACCWAGACEAINYSEAKWIGVNRDWFERERSDNCPGDCGPAPACAVRSLDENFTARCVDGICEKVPVYTENITAVEIEMNQTVNETEPERPEGILFAEGNYLLVLEDVVLPRHDARCGAFSIRDAGNFSEMDKLLVCEGSSKTWTSPEGRQFRLLVVEVAAGYTKQTKWAEVIIFG